MARLRKAERCFGNIREFDRQIVVLLYGLFPANAPLPALIFNLVPLIDNNRFKRMPNDQG